MKLTLSLACALLMGTSVFAQTTTAPLSSDNAATHLVRAAGMSLRDGDLPPGILTVRVVQGGFTGNVANQLVTVQIIGGATETATTGSDGRAQFPHMPIGGRAQAWTVLGTEKLMSDEFDIPSEAGLRVLLAAGGEATASGVAPAFAPGAPVAPIAAASDVSFAPPAASPTSASTGIIVIRVLLALTSIVCFGLFVFARRYRLVRRTEAARPVEAQPSGA